MALLRSLLEGTSGSTDLNWQLLTAGVSYKLARLLLNILGAAAALIHCPALLRSLTIAHLLHWLVALLHFLVVSLLLECDAALLLKVLFANLFLAWCELSHVGVVALLHVLVGALQDGLLLKAGHGLLLLNTAQASLSIFYTSTEVNPALHCFFLPSSSGKLVVVVVADKVGDN